MKCSHCVYYYTSDYAYASTMTLVKVSQEVLKAVSSCAAGGVPNVVLLESTILTHGLPYPHNLRMARSVQEIIRERVRTINCSVIPEQEEMAL